MNNNLNENINISGDFNGTLNFGSVPIPSEPIKEKFCADVIWEGKLYRMEFSAESRHLPSKNNLTQDIQEEYPGAMVHNIYPAGYTSNRTYQVTGLKRYQPEKLTWAQE